MCGHSSGYEKEEEGTELEKYRGVRAEGSREAWC